MPPIDHLLKLATQQGANELRVGTGKAPSMFASGAPKPLTLRPTGEDELRYLLGPLLSQEREALLRRDGQLEFSYFVAETGNFHVTMTRRGVESKDGPLAFDGVFFHGPRAGAAPPAPEARAPEAHASEARSPEARSPEPRAAEVRSAETRSPDVRSFEPRSAEGRSAQGRGGIAEAAGPWSSGARAESGGQGGEGLLDAGASLESDAAREAPRALAALLAVAVDARGSDLHLVTGEPPHARVDGRLRALGGDPVESVEAVLGGLLGAAERQRLLGGRSVDLAVHVPGSGRFRLNVYRSSAGLSLAARSLPTNVPTLSSLNMPLPLDDLADLPGGLVIITGPTGSGKSTTLAALAQEALRRRSILLLTLEDPIEYVFAATGKGSLVRQRQVGREVASFAAGLRDALREDPDVILIGEMRDPESIALALTAAETGHLVLTSLHSRSASSAVERIVDAYPPERQRQIRVQLADALRAVVAQRLLPRARGAGRLPAVEVLRVNHGAASHIREGKTEQLPSDIQTGRREGMIPLERCLADLVRAGHVAPEQARAVANSPDTLAEYLRGG